MSIFIAGVFSILETSKAQAAVQSLGHWPRHSVQSPRRHAPNLLHSSLLSKPPDQPSPDRKASSVGLGCWGAPAGPPTTTSRVQVTRRGSESNQTYENAVCVLSNNSTLFLWRVIINPVDESCDFCLKFLNECECLPSCLSICLASRLHHLVSRLFWKWNLMCTVLPLEQLFKLFLLTFFFLEILLTIYSSNDLAQDILVLFWS